MQQEHKKPRFAGKGYYIALILCLCAVGISGYVFARTVRNSAVETMAALPEQETVQQVPSASVSPAPTPSVPPRDLQEDAYEEDPAAPGTAEAGDPEAAAQTMASLPVPEPETPEQEEVLWPLEGEVTAVFSNTRLTWSETMSDWRTHEGLDLSAEEGDAVGAAQAGTVSAVYNDDYLGTVVVVSHSGDLATLYGCLMEEPPVTVGEELSAGDTLGYVGSTALLEAAEGPHLHFQVFDHGEELDPLDYLPE